VRRRLVIENDDRLFSLEDCIALHEATGVPVLLDVFHHGLNGDESSPLDCLRRAAGTWSGEDGPLMVDYSSQEPGDRVGTHAQSIDTKHFRKFVKDSSGADFDLMLEIKDKEKSALKALKVLRSVGRL
jgi:UV DNA damage endonuclease